jgi:hypothetical protein
MPASSRAERDQTRNKGVIRGHPATCLLTRVSLHEGEILS